MSDHAKDIRRKLSAAADRYSSEGDYWFHRFSGDWTKSSFPYDSPRDKHHIPSSNNTTTFDFPPETVQRLLKVSNGYDYTLHMIFTAATAVLLNKYTANRDITLGAPIYKQDNDAEFVNTALALRFQLEENTTFKELLLQVRQTIMDADKNQNYPLEALLYRLGLGFSPENFPLFDTAVLLSPIHDKNYLHHIPLPLMFCFSHSETKIQGQLDFDPLIFKNSTIQRLINHFLLVLTAMIFSPETRISDLEWLTGEEKAKILETFNNTDFDYPIDKTLNDLFDEQVEKYPDRTALEYNGNFLTYKELKNRSLKPARVLKSKGVGPDRIVGLMTERNLEMMVGIMGILRAGGAYLPFNTDSPPQRIENMLKDSAISEILVQQKHRQSLPSTSTCTTLDLETIIKEEISETTGILENQRQQELKHFNLAYVLYTSGSTGLPKASMIRHQNIHHLVVGLKDRITAYREHDDSKGQLKIALIAPYFFDASVKQIFAALLLGHCLSIVPDEVRGDGQLLPDYYRTSCIDVSDGTPTHLRLMLENLSNTGYSLHIKQFIIGGEALPTQLAEDFLKIQQNSRHTPIITNIYGVTECTVDSTSFEIDPTALSFKQLPPTIPIGKPMPNTRMLIIDRNFHPQPTGITGEIIITGHGIGRGYLNRPELTGEKFLAHELHELKEKKNKEEVQILTEPDHSGYISQYNGTATAPTRSVEKGDRQENSPHAVGYKTGDLACWLEGGGIEFRGRVDFQVKVRGYRVELGEIESRLRAHPFVKDAVVIAREDGNADVFLCAYVVLSSSIETPELKKYLAGFMPDYMVPPAFVRLEKLPVTPNGKIDRRALPEPGAVSQTDYVPPRDAVEEQLVKTWSDVLGIGSDVIGIDANFFELGGHSLKATILLGRIHKTMDVKVPLAEVFKNPTIRGLAEFIKKSKESGFTAISLVEEKEYYSLSPAMKRLYFEHLLSPHNTNYNITIPAWLEGELDIPRLQDAFTKLIQRHETLRTCFITVHDEPVQRIFSHVDFSINQIEIPRLTLSPATPPDEFLSLEASLDRVLYDFVKPYDLSTPPLFKAGLIRIADSQYVLMVEVHHMAADGTSIGLIMKDLMALYSGYPLPGLRIRYKDYSQWKNSPEFAVLRQKQEAFWLEQFRDEIPVLNLPYDFARPPVKSSEGSAFSVPLGIDETKKLKELALKHDTTIYTVLIAVFNILIARLSGLEDIVIGTPSAGRSHTDLEPLVGMFVDTLALRNYPEGNKTFNTFLDELKRSVLTVFENQDYNFEDLVSKILTHRDASRSPIFDAFFALQNMDIPEVNVPGLRLRPYAYERKVARFDLSFIMIEDAHQVWAYVEYCTKLFKRETMERLVDFYKKIAGTVLENSHGLIRDIDIISEEEKEKILFSFNDNDTGTSIGKTIPALFDDQAEQFRDRIAVIGPLEGGELDTRVHISYRELNDRCSKVARSFQIKGVGPDTIVGICMRRSIEMIAGIMGILKAGGAYLPLDPEYPKERIDYMLKDSGTETVITAANLYGDPESMGEPERERERVSGRKHAELNPSNLAYIIYTSGTTGKPKGTMTCHHNVIRVVKDTNYMDFKETDRVLQLSNYAFDGSVFDIYGALLNGAALVMVTEKEMMALHRLGALILRQSVTLFFITASLFNALVDENATYFTHVRKIVVGGERLSMTHTRRAFEYLGKNRLVNGYGPTETTVFAACHTIDDIDEGRGSIPIGKPVTDTIIYILDQCSHVVPIGVAGEIIVGGGSTARGYLNRPELTAERFIEKTKTLFKKRVLDSQKFLVNSSRDKTTPTKSFWSHLFTKRWAAGGSLYKTGDLGRWMEDGSIEFLGRMDQQVKLRGFRVELGEIESHLMKHRAVKEAIVVVLGEEFGSAGRYLCAYVVMHSTYKTVSEVPGGISKELCEFLEPLVPHYMVPSYFVVLERFPLTPNGKLDKRALPVPLAQVASFIPPRDEVEDRLARIWSQVLSYSPVGIDDDFYEHGGHSLKATIMMSRIHREFQVDIPLVEIFLNPTVRNLGAFINNCSKSQSRMIEAVEAKEYYPVGSIQSRMYFLQQVNPYGIHYNMPGVMRLEGRIDVGAVEHAFKTILKRHESLRTAFPLIYGEPVQRVYEDPSLEIEHYNVDSFTSTAINPIISRFIRPFDLNIPLLMRVGIIIEGSLSHSRSNSNSTSTSNFNYPSHSMIVMMDFHHIAVDGLSLGIIVKELASLYAQYVDASGSQLPPLPLQYKDYTQWMHSAERREVVRRQEDFWLSQFEEGVPVLELPLDFPRPPMQGFSGDSVGFEIGPADTACLKEMARRQNSTLYMVLLAVFNVYLFKIAGQEDIVVGTPVSGRKHADLENVVGMFVNTLVLRHFPSPEKTFTDFLSHMSGRTLNAFDNQEYPFDELVEKISLSRDPGRNPLFDVMFILQPLDIRDMEIRDLKLTAYPYTMPVSKFDITFKGVELEEGVSFNIEYRTDLFREETIRRFAVYFQRVVSLILANPDAQLSSLEIIPGQEKQQLLEVFNNTYIEYPGNKTLHGLFEEQVERTPHEAAISIFDKSFCGGLHPGQVQGRFLQKEPLEKGCSEEELSIHNYQLTINNDEKGIKGDRQETPLRGDLLQCRDIGITTDSDLFADSDKMPSTLTYRELNEKGDRLEIQLRQRGVRPDTIVGLMVEPSIEMAVGILGILKAGGAYLPIDPQYPAERIDYMIKDSGTGLILTENEIRELMEQEPAPLIVKEKPGGGNLAYVIYTSGTTGKPKGVLIQHDQVVNTLISRKEEYGMTSHDTSLQLFSYSFDGFVTSFFTPLVSGSKVVLVDREEMKDMMLLKQAITQHNVTHFICIPGFYQALVESFSPQDLASVKVVTLAGDRLPQQLVETSRLSFPWIELAHEYGVTEAAVMSTIYRHQENDDEIKIGRPIANTQIFTLDKWTNMQPLGTWGELCIGGRGVARGYLNRPELTAERFDLKAKTLFEKRVLDSQKLLLPHCVGGRLQCRDIGTTSDLLVNSVNMEKGDSQEIPPNKNFCGGPGGGFLEKSPLVSLYKTGDLARWMPDGFLRFSGRIDRQVKISGYRIETGEIENVLLKCPGVREVCVVALEGVSNQEYLCAYYVSEQLFTPRELRDYLAVHLPSYMVPAHFMRLDVLPLNRSGKVDRKALPIPEAGVHTPVMDYVAPRIGIERKLAEVFSGILNIHIDKIGVNDSFFELGGSSIQLIMLTARIQEFFNVSIPLNRLVRNSTIKETAQWVLGNRFISNEEDIVVMLNREIEIESESKKKIFIFPPAVGYGIAYMEFAAVLSQYGVYAFNFLEGEDRFQKYADVIQQVQPEGSYVLFGYSAGGKLCLKTAEELEKRGCCVSQIIMMECYMEAGRFETGDFEEQAALFFDSLRSTLNAIGAESLIGKATEKVKSYHRFFVGLKEFEKVEADIHFIFAEDKYGTSNLPGWEKLTKGRFKLYKGFGKHEEMLGVEYMERNAGLVVGIIEG